MVIAIGIYGAQDSVHPWGHPFQAVTENLLLRMGGGPYEVYGIRTSGERREVLLQEAHQFFMDILGKSRNLQSRSLAGITGRNTDAAGGNDDPHSSAFREVG